MRCICLYVYKLYNKTKCSIIHKTPVDLFLETIYTPSLNHESVTFREMKENVTMYFNHKFISFLRWLKTMIWYKAIHILWPLLHTNFPLFFLFYLLFRSLSIRKCLKFYFSSSFLIQVFFWFDLTAVYYFDLWFFIFASCFRSS